MWPDSSETISPMSGSVTVGNVGRADQTNVTRLASSIQLASGGPSAGSAGRAIGKTAARRASSSDTRWPRLSPEPGGPAEGDGRDGLVGEGVDETLTEAVVVALGPGADAGANTIRSPGSPNVIAPATAARIRTAASARTRLRGSRRRGSHVGLVAGPVPAASSRRRARRAGSNALVTAGTASRSANPRRRTARSSSPRCSIRRRSAILPASILGESEPKPPDRPREPRLGGAARDPQDVSRLGFAQLEEEPGRDHIAVVFPESVDRGKERSAGLAVEDRRLGRWGRITRPAILGSPEDEACPPAGGPPPVPRFVGDDPEEPWPERRVRAKSAQRGVRLDERLLGGVFGVAIGRDDPCRSDGRVLIPTDERLVRHDVASPRAFDQLGVGLSVASLVFQWTASTVNRGGYTERASTVPPTDRRATVVRIGRCILSTSPTMGSANRRRADSAARVVLRVPSQDVDERGNEHNGNPVAM